MAFVNIMNNPNGGNVTTSINVNDCTIMAKAIGDMNAILFSSDFSINDVEELKKICNTAYETAIKYDPSK